MLIPKVSGTVVMASMLYFRASGTTTSEDSQGVPRKLATFRLRGS